MGITRMTDLDLQGKRVLVRADFNVPLDDHRTITDDSRLRAGLPTIRYAAEAGARVVIVSHLGRPKGKPDPAFSLAPVAERLGKLLDRKVPLIEDWFEGSLEALDGLRDGDVAVLENVRFHPGETADDEGLSKKLATLCDIYVNDAFGTAHRAQSSTHGVARHAPVACAGLLLLKEIEHLTAALEDPKRPLVAIIGGAKVSDKLGVLQSLSARADQLIVGGGIANTFLLAEGYSIGSSLAEPGRRGDAEAVITACRDKGAEVPLPTDVIVSTEFSAQAPVWSRRVDAVSEGDVVQVGEMILDFGPESAQRVASLVKSAGTILWNGPLGAFELPQCANGTRTLAEAVAESSAFSVVGGGDTVAALAMAQTTDRVSYISTGGGAFLEWVEGRKLPAIAVLEERGEQP